MKLPTFLAAHAAHRPRHTAVIGERRVSFAELDESTGRAADQLPRNSTGKVLKRQLAGKPLAADEPSPS